MKMKLKVSGQQQIMANISKLKRDIPIKTANEMLKNANNIKKRSTKNIIEADLIAFKNMIKSVYITPLRKVKNKWVTEVGYVNKSALYQHQGWDNQSMPPLKPIEEWVVTKLGVGFPEATWIAYGIALNLMTEGHKPTPFLQEAIDYEKNKIPKNIQKGILNWLRKTFNKK